MAKYLSPEAQLFHEGIDLFNRGEWFEAHESWEEIWHMAEGDKKRFYQGLIQYTVTIEHIRRGNPRGVCSVYKTCIPKFDGLPCVYMGINVDYVRSSLKAMTDPVFAMEPQAFDPARGQGQAMPVDLDDAPKIELAYDPFEELKNA
jgi:hypothetical protein